MKAARPDHSSAEPILLTEAALEHVLDVFLPEGPETAAVVARIGPSGADPAEDFFASETAAEERGDLPLRATSEERPWRTYSPPTEGDSVSARSTSPAATRVRRPIRTWAITAAFAIGVATIGSIAVQPRLARQPAVVDAGDQPAVDDPPAPELAGRAAEVAMAAPVATVVAARPSARHEARASLVPAPVPGTVLKGSLTPEVKPGRAIGPATRPAREAVAKPPRVEAPVTSSASTLAVPPPLEPAPAPASSSPAPAPAISAPVETPPAPPAPAAVRDAAPAPREAPPARPATAVESPATTVASDSASIEAVLSRYRQAFTALDANAARAVWPGVDARALGRAFDQLVEQQLEFQNCSIAVNGVHATAACGGRARYVPRVGSRSPRDEPREWTFSLQKTNGQWLIERVASR